MTIKTLHVEVFPGRTGVNAPEAIWWYWRIRWANGKIAAVSEGYTRKATALRLARKMSDHLLMEVPVEQPVQVKARGRS